ncbi:uncharacterized protein MONOS_5228 [Monocercomonoides exilis]|uniref:uncharacterized protein n=1 Tax=Monocercomonoides exilis TaxID=2049356 RepID=UPI003559A70D|nr:hypothetical protein MONOS_5228 [Monocercomonoides exilis]|eukprot:MONOS_5228.1-p1 / transcript=MONOS_5228.1 / gene=MONOS_5228 / organism=Monocercomonoides_exilis_PA203 / gene_product=unspecified product / transcript_product=unspecified product / location=Mono_scaffold00149:107572-107992(-) / protein_length=73 / sequence_SO=supercontig / SO=protein_coding / is_pseudo=false
MRRRRKEMEAEPMKNGKQGTRDCEDRRGRRRRLFEFDNENGWLTEKEKMHAFLIYAEKVCMTFTFYWNKWFL